MAADIELFFLYVLECQIYPPDIRINCHNMGKRAPDAGSDNENKTARTLLLSPIQSWYFSFF